jgi:NAD(P)-dependent dehydrogenase (short-subunit alcohol dehydrogenase family)
VCRSTFLEHVWLEATPAHTDAHCNLAATRCHPVVLQTANDVVSQVVQQLGHVDILVNNASEQHMAASLADVTPEELVKTFQTNIFGYYYFAQVQQQQLQHARVPQ